MPVHGQIPVAFSLHRFVQATSPSAAPVSATTAEAAPAGAGAWRAPRCGPGSNWTETLCSECERGETYFILLKYIPRLLALQKQAPHAPQVRVKSELGFLTAVSTRRGGHCSGDFCCSKHACFHSSVHNTKHFIPLGKLSVCLPNNLLGIYSQYSEKLSFSY